MTQINTSGALLTQHLHVLVIRWPCRCWVHTNPVVLGRNAVKGQSAIAIGWGCHQRDHLESIPSLLCKRHMTNRP